MKTAVIFNRVSTKEQSEGYSLEAQAKLNRAYADKNGLKVLKSFSISESASKSTQRKIFDEMVQYVAKNNIPNIISEKVDRFTRRIKEAAAIHDWLNEDENRFIHFSKEGLVVNKNSKSHEKFILNMKVAVAQFYADNLSEEVKKGQEEKLSQNRYPGRAKFGYKTVEINGHRAIIPDEHIAPKVTKLLKLFAADKYSIQSLAKYMFEEESLRSKGGKIHPSFIYRLLSDPFYYGDFIWNGTLYHGQHEKLITKEVFDRNQYLLKRKNAPQYTLHTYLFKGLTECIECHRSITWETHKSILYGYCNRYTPCTQIQSIKENEIEDKLIIYLDYLKIKNQRLLEWIRKAIKEGYQDESDYQEHVIQETQTLLQQTQKKLKNLLDMRVDEEIDKATYQIKYKELSDEKEKLENSIKNHSQQQTKFAKYSVSFYELSQRAKEIYLKAKPEDKKSLLKLLFSTILVDIRKKEIIPMLTKPFQIVKELVDYTNEISSKVAKMEENAIKKFEPQEEVVMTTQTPLLLPAYSELRRGRDSNPRELCSPTRFPGVRHRPTRRPLQNIYFL